MTALAARRRSPLAGLVLVLLGLIVTGVAYAASWAICSGRNLTSA